MALGKYAPRRVVSRALQRVNFLFNFFEALQNRGVPRVRRSEGLTLGNALPRQTNHPRDYEGGQNVLGPLRHNYTGARKFWRASRGMARVR